MRYSKWINSEDKIILNNMIRSAWDENEEIQSVLSGEHNDVFSKQERIKVIKMLEKDNYEMRIQRVISGMQRESINKNINEYSKQKICK